MTIINPAGSHQRPNQNLSVSLGVWVVLTISLLSGAGCATPGTQTAIGAGAGAATGAIVGGATNGRGGAGLGAAAGGLVGGAVGNYLDKQAQELSQVAETQRTESGILVQLKNDLLFNTGSAVLQDEAITNLLSLGDVLAKYKKDRIRVEGFTDNTGSQVLNESLSLRRAEAVKNVLIGRGVQENQMMVLGFGKNKPIATNSTSSGRSMNRRVELHITEVSPTGQKPKTQTG